MTIKPCECTWEDCEESAPEGTPDWGNVQNECTGGEDLYLCPKHCHETTI